MRYAAYYKKMLSKEEQSIYDIICSEIALHQSPIKTPHFDCSRLHKIIFSVKYDNPEFFYVDYSNVSAQILHTHCEINISYIMDVQQCKDIINQISHVASNLFQHIKSQSSLKQALYLHDWLIKNTTYSTDNYFSNSSHTMVGAILYGKCVCEGYAMAYKYFMDIARIYCTIVCGEGIHPDGTSGSHAWNLLVLNNKPYHVDVTFDHLFAGKYCSRAYFLLSTKEILIDHSIDDLVPIPICKENGGVLQYVTRTRELVEFLDIESKRNVAHSEVRLSARFTKEQLFNMIDNWLSIHTEVKLSRNPQYWFGDYSRTLFIIWM